MRIKSRQYNLVEVILALGVMAIGVVSVMALFPVGSSAARDASMETYAANAADEMLQLIRYRVKDTDGGQTGIDNRWKSIIGTTASEGLIEESTLDDVEDAENDYNDKLDDDSEWKNDSTKDLFSGALKGNESIYQYKDKGTVYQLIGHHNESGVTLGDTDFEDNVDFRAIAYIWKEEINLDKTATDLKVPYGKGARVVVRVTWPAELPYKARQKADYSLEILKTMVD